MGKPGIFGRIAANLGGEIVGDALAAYRRAGAAVYDLLDDLERIRLEQVVQEQDAWTVPEALQAALLCGWNAFALQTLADEMVQADYDCRPLTAGYVDRATHELSLACYGQVAGWLSRAQQALQNELYELDVQVPAPLPPWPDRVSPCPLDELEGLLRALARVRTRAEAAMWEGEREDVGDRQRQASARIRQLGAEGGAAADYALSLRGDDEPPAAIVIDVETQAKSALERFYLLGQVVMMPSLALQPLPKVRTARSRPGRPRLLPGPGEPGFEPWCLTDPRLFDTLRYDRDAANAIGAMWAEDRDPTRTLSIKSDIDAALFRHDIAYEAGHYYLCPWSPIYVVKRPVRIAGKTLHPLQHFTYDRSTEETPRGVVHHRRIVIGPFHPRPTSV